MNTNADTNRADLEFQIKQALTEILTGLAQDMRQHIARRILPKLTSDELATLAKIPKVAWTQPNQILDAARAVQAQGQYFRAARVLLLATFAERIPNQWSAESLKPEIKALKRLLNSRQI